ncbi:pantetheine-phosphate adenylyltransferase [bacterium]|nr:pantetheine-phosphate adenylyltransferase [bacterium]
MPSTVGSTPRIALYPGSFDGLTFGHLDLIKRGCKLFDRLVVGVAANSRKNPWFTAEERMEHIHLCTAGIPNIEIIQIEGLTVKAAVDHGAQFILRGLRAVSDFDFEFQLAIMNHEVMPNVETIFLATSPEYIFLSSSMVKEVWSLGADVSRFIPQPVLEAFERRRAAGA